MLSPVGENSCSLPPPSLPIGSGLILNRSVTFVENIGIFEKPKCFVETAIPPSRDHSRRPALKGLSPTSSGDGRPRCAGGSHRALAVGRTARTLNESEQDRDLPVVLRQGLV